MHGPWAGLLGATLLVAAGGCGSSSADPEARLSAAKAFQEGIAAYDRRDYAAAGDLLSQALEDGLAGDYYADAAVKRTVCWGATGKYDEALAELTRLEAGAPNLDEVNAARSFVLRKQGKAAESRTALAAAKRINPRVQEIKD